MALALLIKPAAKPVTLEDVKRHLRVETDADDEYLDTLVDMATAHVEAVTGLKLVRQVWRQYSDCAAPSGVFYLEVAPVIAVTDVRVYEANGAFREIPVTSLELDNVSNPARLRIAEDVRTGRAFNGIEIDIVAGFGETGVDVPDALKRAVLLLSAHAYEFRGAVPLGQQPASEPQGFQTLIAPYKQVKL